MNTINTHELYNTVSHNHITIYPEGNVVELNVVQTGDNKYFIENAWKDEIFEKYDEISNFHKEPYKAPKFYNNEKDAVLHAIEILKSEYPGIENTENFKVNIIAYLIEMNWL